MEKKTYFFAVSNEEKTNIDTAPYMDYLTTNGTKWRAEYQEGRFIHSPEGNKEKSHEDSYLAYLEPGGRKWHMTIENGQFVLRAVSGEKEIRKTDICHFTGWDGKGRWVSLTENDGDLSGIGDLLQNSMKDLIKF